jgi:glutathione synthase/RimK-type ligase-like ATP-grasp enzyme
MNKAFARQLRLRKQQKKLKEKAGKILQYDLYTIDILEEFEEKERLEKERAE